MPRKRPFSAKRKKQQLRDRRERKRGDPPAATPGSRERDPGDETPAESGVGGGKPGPGPGAAAAPPDRPRSDPGRFRLQLGGLRGEALARQRRRAQEEPLQPVPDSGLEIDTDLIYGNGLNFPRRPPWSFRLGRERLQQREEETFRAFLGGLRDAHGGDLAPFEHNLETWRQLWRVLEMSDLILLITDARHPALGVPPSLASHVLEELGKGLVLVLNKVDLTPAPLAAAWSRCLRSRFPGARIVPFSSAAGRPRRGRGSWSRALGPRQLLEACESIVGGEVDLSSWRARLERREEEEEEEGEGKEEEQQHQEEEEEEEEEEEQQQQEGDEDEDEDEEEEGEGSPGPPRQWERYRRGVLTIGCVGLPNAGKSSVLNALLGRGAVSVSRAPGRTRYFQTHFLTPRVRLCDCPGLVFPSRAPPALQVLAGVYPISQLRDPFSAISYLAARLPLGDLLQLPPPGPRCTAWDLCEAWAEKRGYRTARAARNDAFRAANGILRMAAEGRIRLCLRPPGYSHEKEFWEHHPDTAALAALLEGEGQPGGPGGSAPPEERSTSEEEEEEEEDEGVIDSGQEEGPGEAPPLPSSAPNPFALLGEDEC